MESMKYEVEELVDGALMERSFRLIGCSCNGTKMELN